MFMFAFVLSSVGVAEGGGARTDCPAPCRCEDEGMRRHLDCVDVGLSEVPSNLSGFTSCLDLSMNELSTLPVHAFAGLHALQELRLAGNGLTDVPKDAFTGLMDLKVLTLQNNHLKQVPSEALENLKKLQSLRLDANFIGGLPAASFRGLASLHHLWLDDNVLAEVPVLALSDLPELQALTLALNNISHVPDWAFASLTQLVVLHLHDNQIHSLGQRCFDGLHNLETLDLSSNALNSFPAAIRSLSNLREVNLQNNNITVIPGNAFAGNPSLETINVRNNPVHAVGRSCFQLLPELRTLFLGATSSITTFPDFTGTNKLETLSMTGGHISILPSNICEELPNLQRLDLSRNLIETLPKFGSCKKLQNLNLRQNSLRVVRSGTFWQMKELRSLDLSFNRLSSVSLEGLKGLTHLKLTGNLQLRAPLPLHQHPRLRVAELPFAFQCCTLLRCFKSTNGVNGIKELSLELHVKKRLRPSVLCSPAPGPATSCLDSLAPWLLRFSVWIVFVLSVPVNFLVLIVIFFTSASKPHAASQRLLGVFFWLRFLAGLSGSALDVRAADCFAAFHPRAENEAGSGLTSFLFCLSSEACVFLMLAIVFQRQSWPDVWGSSVGGIQVTSAACLGLALAATTLPLMIFGEISFSSRCLIVSFHRRVTCWGYSAALVIFNAFCFLFMMITHVSHQEKVRPNLSRAHDDGGRKTMLTFLLLTNSLLFLSATLLSLASLLHFSDPEVSKWVLLLLTAIPVCLDPLVFVFLSPDFTAELCCLFHKTSRKLKMRGNTEHSEKSVPTLVSVSL